MIALLLRSSGLARMRSLLMNIQHTTCTSHLSSHPQAAVEGTGSSKPNTCVITPATEGTPAARPRVSSRKFIAISPLVLPPLQTSNKREARPNLVGELA